MKTMMCLAIAAAAVLLMAAPRPTVAREPVNAACCIDHPNKPTDNSFLANVDCSRLTLSGKERCEAAYSAWDGQDWQVCQWAEGDDCKPKPKPCQRVELFKEVEGQKLDVGSCAGECEKEGRCKPTAFKTHTTSDGRKISIIDKCGCDDCAAVDDTTAIEVPTGRCEGKCTGGGGEVVCHAGLSDNFNVQFPEPSSPSNALRNGFGGICSWGIQPGFDYFADNQCFAHTFSDCFKDTSCPLRGAVLTIRLKAAQVPLTNTDSIILGVGGSSLWGKGLPYFNGGSWNPNDDMTLNLDLDNLPPSGGGVTSILADVEAAQMLDVVIQDDTAVDYMVLRLKYERCQVCVPTHSYMSTLYTRKGVREFEDIQNCDCVDAGECARAPFVRVYYPNTPFEQRVDVGQCLGRCQRGQRCYAKYEQTTIKAPEGPRKIKTIADCDCGKPVISAQGYITYGLEP